MRIKEAQDTKSKILDVAESLFAEQGLDRVTVRDITEAAEVNLAAINYHFGSKEELIGAVFERRIAPLNKLRLAALDELERANGDNPPQVEQIVAAFILPEIQLSASSPKGNDSCSKLFSRCISEANLEVQELLRKQFEPVRARMEAAFLRALPHLSRVDVFWRMKFMFGAFHHWLLTREKFVPGFAKAVDPETQTQKLIAFVSAGFRAAA